MGTPAMAKPDALSPRDARAQAQRNRILDAAQKCFAERGFHGAGMALIADTAQMSPGLIYRYFAGKSELIHGIVSRQIELMAEDLETFQAGTQDAAALIAERFREDADGSGGKQKAADAFIAGVPDETAVVMQHRWDNPRRAVGGCGDHASTGGVFLVDCQGEQVDPFHGAQGRTDHVRLTQLLQAAMQLGGPSPHIQAAGQDALVLEALLDAILHGTPELHQATADFFFRAPDLFVGQHQVGDAQVVSLA